MSNALIRSLSSVRRKLQAEHIIRGLAILAGFVLIASVVASIVLARHNFSDSALFWVRAIGLGAALLLLLRFVILPLFRFPSRRRVARFLEERHPDLQDRLSTAVELQHPTSTVHPEIRRLIEQDAAKRVSALPRPGFYYPRLSLASTLVALVAVLLISALFLSGPEAYRYSLNKLLLGWLGTDALPLYLINVQPGSTTVGKHTDLEVRARLSGFHSDDVQLQVRYAQNPQWERTSMQVDPRSGDFVFLFYDVREPLEYFVESEGIRSDGFQVDVSEVPRIRKLTLTLDYPAYSGMPDSIQEEDGDIRALKGTVTTFDIETDQPVQQGMIRLDKGENEGREIALSLSGTNRLSGRLTVAEDAFYRIHLTNSVGLSSPGSDEFLIEALEDQPPSVMFTTPGRDRRVTNLEEVFTEVRAEDDFGLVRLSLHFSINGGEEQQAPLSVRRGEQSTTSSHTFYLEEFDLQPGDFVSYFARASDAVTTASSDIYFLEVEPYDREFYQSQQSGNMGAAGGENIDLAGQQKQIVVATFNLGQEQDRYPRKEFEESSQTLALLQQRLQTQVKTISERIRRREAIMADPRFQKMAEALDQSAEFMEPAHQELNAVKPEKALPNEQKALQQLLRAESLFKEIQVSFASSASSQSSASAEQLADLVDLELDRTKNQYETIQQNQELGQAQALDEALEKLKELARRQEQQEERRRRQGMQSAGGGASQQQLIDELEELSRQLQRLSRQKQDPQLAEVSRQLNRAARDLRQSQSSGQNSQQAQMSAQQALDRLKEAQQQLGRQRQDQVQGNLQELRRRSQELLGGQQQVLEQVRDVEDRYGAGQLDDDLIRRMQDTLRRKSDLQEDVQKLESDLHQAARQIESQEPGAARKLKEAGLNIRDERIPEKMQEGSQLLSQGLMNMARSREEGVEEDLRGLAENIRQAQEAVGSGQGQDPQQRLQQALDQTGSLAERLESLQQHASSSQAGGNASSGPDPGRRREWQERVRELEEIRRTLSDHPELGREAASLLRNMRDLELDKILSDPQEVARLKSLIIDGLHQLELEINQTLQEQGGTLLRLANEDEIPAEFRERVEEYYRQLSKQRP